MAPAPHRDAAGISGLFPLVRELPVCFTNTISREHKIFKYTRGVVSGWELEDADVE